jgi:hypothetical protein
MNWKKVAAQFREDASALEINARRAFGIGERESMLTTARMLLSVARGLEAGLMTGEEVAREALSLESDMRAVVRNTKEYNTR